MNVRYEMHLNILFTLKKKKESKFHTSNFLLYQAMG